MRELGFSLTCFMSCSFLTRACVVDPPVRIIFDTDMASDCVDVGALAVLHALADQNEAEVFAVVTNRRCPADASVAVGDVANTYYGRGNIPIATDRDGAKVRWNKPSAYTPTQRDEFPHDTPGDKDRPDAVDLYRRVLANQPDASVVICSVGALSNREDLLESGPDEYSDPNGKELIIAKVKTTVIMGGNFPRSLQHPRAGNDIPICVDTLLLFASTKLVSPI
jgi:inosine-uridine nucleoside N-ribohydrolase